MENIRELTKAEEQVMKALWQIGKGSIKEIADLMSDPKPAYTTIATQLKVLKTKGFVTYEINGSAYNYIPLVVEKDYRKFAFDKVFSGYFGNSYQRLLSFLVEEKTSDPVTQLKLRELAEKLKDQ